MAEIVIDIRSNNAESRLNSLRSNFQRTDRTINDTTGSIGRLNRGIVGLIGTIGGLTLAKSAFDSIQTGFKSLENLTLEVSKTTGLAGEDLKRLTSELDTMSTTMGGFEVKGLYQIAESAGQLGIHGVENLKTFTKEMQYMASSSKLTAEESSVGFAEIANALNLPISEINKLTSSFSKLASTTTADEAKLLDFTQRLAGAGKTLGLSNAQIVAVGATMKDVGVNVEVGGTAMSQVFQKMLKDTESFAKVSHVSLSEYSKMIDEKPVKALELFLSSLGKLDKRAKIKALDDMKMSGSGLSSTLLKLSSNTKKLEANIKTSADAYKYGKATQDEYKVASESLTAQQQKAESAVLLLQKALGEQLKPMMISINNTTVDGIHWMMENGETLQKVGVVIGSVTGTYYALTTAQKINTAWTTGQGAIGMIGQFTRVGQLGRAIAITTATQKAMNLAIKVTPWGLAIAGVTAVALAVNESIKVEEKYIEVMALKETAIKNMTETQLKSNKELLRSQLQQKLLEKKKLRFDVAHDGIFESNQNREQDKADLARITAEINEIRKMNSAMSTTLRIKKEVKKTNALNLAPLKKINEEYEKGKNTTGEILGTSNNIGTTFNTNLPKMKSLTNEENKHKKELRDALKLEEERLKKEQEAVKLAYELSFQNITIKALNYELLHGEENKLTVLKEQLELLHTQDALKKNEKDINAHEISILNKELEIKRAIKEQEDKAREARDKEVTKKIEDSNKTYDAKKDYLSRIGYDKLVKEMENKELLVKLSPYLSKDEMIKLENKLEHELNPNFADGIADAFNLNKNASLRDAIDEIGYRIGNSSKDALNSIISNMKNGMSLSQATTVGLNDTARGMYSDMKNSSNPYIAGAGYAVDIIEALGSTFEPLIVNEHADNKEIINSMDILNNTMYPHLELTKKMSQSLESMDKKFNGIARSVLFGKSDLTGSKYQDYNGGFGDTKVGTYLGDALDGLHLGLLDGLGKGVMNFISGKKVTLENAGIHFGEQDASSYQYGVNADGYQNIRTRRSMFGVNYSDSSSKDFNALDASLKNDLDSIFADGTENILTMAESVGVLNGQTNLAGTKLDEVFLDFKDKSEEEIKQLLQGEIGDRLSQITQGALGGSLDAFRQSGEGYYELLTRTSIGYEQATEALRRLHIQAVDFQNIDNKNGNVSTETIRDSLLNTLGRETETRTRNVYSTTDIKAVDGAKRTMLEQINNSVAMAFGDADSTLAEAIAGFAMTGTEEYQVIIDDNLTGVGEIIKGFKGTTEELLNLYGVIEPLNYRMGIASNGMHELTQSMIDVAGSAKNFNDMYGSYLTNYYTDAERSTIAIAEMNRQFEQAHISIPKSKDALRDYIEGIDTSTKAGQEQYATAIKLSATYANVMEEQTNVEKKRIEDIQSLIKDTQIGNLSILNMFDKTKQAQSRFYSELTADTTKDYLTNLKRTATTREEYNRGYVDTISRLRATETKEKVMKTSSPEVEKKLDDLGKKVESLTTQSSDDNKKQIDELKTVVQGLKDLIENNIDNAEKIVDATEKASYQKAM